EELELLEHIPRLAAIKAVPNPWLTKDEIKRAMSLPDLRYLSTTASALIDYPISENIVGLSVTGAPLRWDFPWVTAFETDFDYFNQLVEHETPLPTNLDKVELLLVQGWPQRHFLPPNVRRLHTPYIEAASLAGATKLEWVANWQFECTGDDGLESFASIELLKEIWLRNGPFTDTGLRALSQATQLERIWLCISEEADISAEGIAAIAAMPNLKRLTLDGQFTDSILMGLHGAVSLESLEFRFHRPAPTQDCLAVIPTIPNLIQLDICGWRDFSGAGTKHLNGLKLRVRHNFHENLTREGCRELIDNWPDTELDLSYYEFLGDEHFETLDSAHQLRSIALPCGNDISRKTLDRILTLSNLESVVIPSIDGIDDDFLIQLSRMPNLKFVSLPSADLFSEQGLLDIVRMPNLEGLGLGQNCITVNILNAMQQSRKLRHLHLPTDIDEEENRAVWALIDSRPNLKVFAPGKGNPYDPRNHPKYDD
ncbi:hypothetical protein OAU50_08815, partial [Planctomycetota bacterium]|nr:hypothetical protein [Planctomycetota bacterium]